MSSWHTSQLTYAFGIGGLMSFYGIMGLVAYMLPSNMISPNGRIIFIALVLLTLPFALLFTFLVSRRRKKREAAEETATAAATAQSSETGTDVETPAKLKAPSGSYAEIDRGIQETVDFLKSSNLGSGSKDALYSLPWYIVAGSPKSGKSSLIIASNLNFQKLSSQRESEQKIIRPTANVDWRVTSEAVFIDTAGRYVTEGMDADEWNALLEAIRKHRPNRPIDGLILVIDGDKTIKSDERETDEAAKVLRSRLDEAVQRLKVRFPVYVVFTHSDGIEGFQDSFSVSKNEGKDLVWGATIPLEKSENAQAQFDPEFEVLRDSVMKRRIVRLSAPFPPVRQLRIFNFPLHFGSARRKVGAFISTLFRPNPFSESPFLRGFYFTATPPAKAAANVPVTVGQTYFAQRLFRDVILRDRDLVATFQAQRQKAPIFGWAMTLIGTGIILLFLTLACVSLFSNKQMLDQARDRGEKLIAITKTDAYEFPAKADESAIRKEINATEELRELLVKLDDYERNGAPWYMRMGLYSGNRVYKQHLLKVYMAVIENRYKKATVKKVTEDLRKFADSNPVVNSGKLTEAEETLLSKNYDLLKAYLMLTGQFKDKADPTHISTALKESWTTESKIPPDLKLVAGQQLDFWAKQVDRDDEEFKFPRIEQEGKLVDDTRKKLQAFPAVFRYYKRKVSEISKIVDDKVGPTSVSAILTRNGADVSLIDGNYSVPSAYTKPGFQLMKKAIAEANEKLSEDDWVMGELGKKDVAQTTDAAKIEERYFRDYADHWRAFVTAVSVKPYKNSEAASTALTTFSVVNSPIEILLIEISKNTNLSAKPEVLGWWEWIKSWIFTEESTDTGGSTPPEKEFKPLFQFIGKKQDKENAPVGRYRSELGTIGLAIKGKSADAIKQIAQELANDKDTLKLRNAENAISGLLQQFNETPSSQAVALLIQQPLGNLRSLLGADAKTQIAKEWTEIILPAAKEIEKGYPFEAGTAEADLTKLTAFLNPVDGKLSKFYDERLKKYFEESNGALKLKDTADVKFSDEFIAYLNNAFALRKALFGTSATPKFEYEFAFKPGKDAIIEVVIDGQKITSEGTASIKGTFPAPASAETGVIMSIAGSAPATTSAPPPVSTSTPSSSTKPATTDTGGASLKFPGNWGLFRFVDAGKAAKQAGGEYSLGYSVGGKAISATIKPSGGDLFDKNIFRQVKAPQNFLK